MTKITLKNGFSFKFNEDILDDWTFQELFYKMNDPESDDETISRAAIKVVNLVFGKDKAMLLEACRDKKTGIVPVEKPIECVGEVVKQYSALKSSAKNS